MQNTGKPFEKSVQAALAATGRGVTDEELVGHKRVDLLARQIRWGVEWTTAIECKDEERPLGPDKLTKIWSSYEALYENGSVDEILVVSRNGFTAAGRTYLANKRGILGQTLDELLDSVIDFRPYLHSLVEAYETSADGIRNYYQAPQVVGGGDLAVLLDRWIPDERPSELPRSQPLAILGAYGVGKSSFSTYYASRLASEALVDSSRRVPILIRLGDIAGEQTLEGLLGKHFTSTHGLTGYTFPALQVLNRRGRLIILLDGFDEMKQLLTWREFGTTFKSSTAYM